MNRALMVGINAYPDPRNVLNGCVNDVTDMAHFLVDNCQFAMDDVRLLTDTRATTSAIIERLGWLLTGLHEGDRVVFHYSGHGAQLPTRNPQGEVDGLDEVICPVDFDWSDAYTIRDKQFNAMFSAVPAGVEFVWISDSCHSGDLSKAFLPPGGEVLDRTIPPPADIDWRLQTAKAMGISAMGFVKAAQELNVALVAGCRSDQTSQDARFGTRFNGVLTHFLLQELGSPSGLAEPLRDAVAGASNALAGHYAQRPQLEGSEVVGLKPFMG